MLLNITRGLATSANKLTTKELVLKKLEAKFGFNLIYADVKNLNWKENLPKDSEKKLEIIVVSNEFEGVKKEKRIQMMKTLLAQEIKNSEVIFKLLTPSLWYDSNQRGLKLDPVYSNAPILNSGEQLASLYKNFSAASKPKSNPN